MANYKRGKPRRSVRCNICTDARTGNSAKATYSNKRPGFVGRAGQRAAVADGLDGWNMRSFHERDLQDALVWSDPWADLLDR